MSAGNYHVNPATGRVGVCKAEKQCRFPNSKHFKTEEAAKKAVEEALSSLTIPAARKKTSPTTKATEVAKNIAKRIVYSSCEAPAPVFTGCGSPPPSSIADAPRVYSSCGSNPPRYTAPHC